MKFRIFVGNHHFTCETVDGVYKPLTSCMYPLFSTAPALGRVLGTTLWVLPSFSSQLLSPFNISHPDIVLLIAKASAVSVISLWPCRSLIIILLLKPVWSNMAFKAPQKHHLKTFPWELSHPRVRSEGCHKWPLLAVQLSWNLQKLPFIHASSCGLPLHNGVSAAKPAFHHPSYLEQCLFHTRFILCW